MFKRIVVSVMIVCIIISMVGCASIKNGIRNITYSQANGIGEQKLIKYLKTKYPEKNFTVESTDDLIYLGTDMDFSFDENLDATRKLTISFWNLTDENGDSFQAIVNNFGISADNGFDIFDNVQANEVKKAIDAKLSDIFNTVATGDGYFTSFSAFDFSSTKFNGDIIDFLKNYKSIAGMTDTKQIYATYFYQNGDFDYTKVLNEENAEFLKHIACIDVVKFKENMPTNEEMMALKNRPDIKTSLLQTVIISNLPNVESLHTIKPTGTIPSENWISEEKFNIVQQGELCYSFPEEITVEKILQPETMDDISKWDEAIKEYQAKNNEKWLSYRIISQEYKHTNDDVNYFFEKPEQKESVVYKLFTINEYGETGVSTIYDQYKISILLAAWARSNIEGNYMFIASNDIPLNGNWFIVECELEK